MKRNYGAIIIGLSQMFGFFGLDMQIGQAEAETIGTAIGGVVLAWGVIHDIFRRLGWMK
jgi:hypothetical protein